MVTLLPNFERGPFFKSTLNTGAKIERPYSHGLCNLRLQGQVCHRIGSLLPLPGEAPKFAQLYIHDSGNSTSELDQRLSHFSSLAGHNDTLLQLQTMLHDVNPYICKFREAATWDAAIPFHMVLKAVGRSDPAGEILCGAPLDICAAKF